MRHLIVFVDGFSINLWVDKCLLRCDDCPNNFLQMSHLKSLILSWIVLMWVFRNCDRPNDFLQMLHLNLLIFSWTCWTWFVKLWYVDNILSQISHLYSLFTFYILISSLFLNLSSRLKKSSNSTSRNDFANDFSHISHFEINLLSIQMSQSTLHLISTKPNPNDFHEFLSTLGK